MLHGFPGEPETKPLFKDVSDSTPQGQIIALTGPSGSGRRTFLELLCMRRFPSKGTIFVPAHLRCVLVTRELYLLNLSLWENLVFGNKEGNNPYRVEKILRFFEMKQILQMCEDDLTKRKKEFDSDGTKVVEDTDDEEEEAVEKENPMDKLRESEKAYIHLARAFVMNPEVIVMHRVFANFHGEHNLELIKRAIVDHRDCRGLMMDKKDAHRRRPRTLIYSSDNKDAIKQTADVIWTLPRIPGERQSQQNNEDKALNSLGADDL
jgi:ABC-type ATPase involved in cell division